MGNPNTLPADFFDKQSQNPNSLPSNFFGGQAQPTVDQSQPTQYEKDRTGNGVLQTLLGDTRNAVLNLPGLLKLVTPSAGVDAAANVTQNDALRKQEGRSGAYRAAAGAGEAIGIPARQMEEAANMGKSREIVGHSLLPAIMAVAPSVASRAIPGAKAMPREQAVDNISNAFNPVAEDMPKFKADLSQHLDSIIQTARQKNIPLTKGASAFAEATTAAGTEARQTYQSKMLGPVADTKVVVPNDVQINGTKLGEGARGKEVTISDIDRRLTEINNTLYPRYQKGGLAAQAAVGAEQAQALRSEQGYLLNTLVKTISDKTGIPTAEVSATRQKMGALRQLGEDMQYYSDQYKHGVNQIANQPIKGDVRPTAYAVQRGQIAYRRRFGNPADKIIGDVVSKYQPK